jgi:hypothetical protein
MSEMQTKPEQSEEREPWDYQPEESGEAGGQAEEVPPAAPEGSEEGGQLEQTSPSPTAEEGGGNEGGAAQSFAPWVQILIEVGMVLLKKAQDQGLIQPGQIKEITERHGVMP